MSLSGLLKPFPSKDGWLLSNIPKERGLNFEGLIKEIFTTMSKSETQTRQSVTLFLNKERSKQTMRELFNKEIADDVTELSVYFKNNLKLTVWNQDTFHGIGGNIIIVDSSISETYLKDCIGPMLIAGSTHFFVMDETDGVCSLTYHDTPMFVDLS